VIQYNKRDLPNASPLEEMRRLLNPKGLPEFEARATSGEGVFETLKAVARGVLRDLKQMSG
jgi:signal recognition particle receptor subunit beta